MKEASGLVSRRAFCRWLFLSAISYVVAGCTTGGEEPCSADPPPIIPRAEWGAVEPNLDAPGERFPYDSVTNPEGWLIYDRPLVDILNTVVVHHSAYLEDNDPLGAQRLHMEQYGFADVGYHFMLDRDGRIYQGRSLLVRGAHTAGFNTGTVGICLLGHFDVYWPSHAQLSNLQGLLCFLLDQYPLTHLAGHQDFQPGQTACPGRHLEPQLPGLAKKVGLKFGTGGYKGP